MMLWELWTNEDRTEWTFLESRGSERARNRLGMDDNELIWTVEAGSRNEAMQLYYDYMGWGRHQPMLRPNGTPYPEDEGPCQPGATPQ